MGGNFEVTTFEIGKKKTDSSFASLIVRTEKPEELNAILSEIHRFGARILIRENINLVPAEGDKIVPQGFYSTTNHPTFVNFQGNTLTVQDIEMDCLIVINPAKHEAQCIPMAKLKTGDLVVVGERGVRITPPERPRELSNFEFMHGNVSSERPTQTIIANIAKEIKEIKQKNGKIAIVGGPAIIHTGASPALAKLIKNGFIDTVFAGNALATHDIEYTLYGTSLGMDILTGKPTVGGHKNHIYAISRIIKAGSIRNAVNTGIVNSGIMYECIKNNVPYVLAGSIRDDGPLPDVVTDTIVAQDKIREYVKDCSMVLMVATLLHSIAVGNCLPSYVKTICVDINPSSVTKLMDRGTMQAIGVVSDAGTFLPILAKELGIEL